MTSLPFWTLDVFAATRFAGNPLAVVDAGQALDAAGMQAVAAEFNLSETVFVTARDAAAGRASIRIFTPRRELPFAGHPTVGAALLLAGQGLGRPAGDGLALVLDEPAGPVPVEITLAAGAPARARFMAPGTPAHGPALDGPTVARLLGLTAADLAAAPPRRAGHGVDFLVVELAGLDALGRARLAGTSADLPANGLENGCYLFTRATPDGTLRARLFAPELGIAEDPATGSAAAALAGLLAALDPAPELDLARRIVQGVEMGRPSVIDITATKRAGRVEQVTVAGGAIPVSEGRITV